MYISISNAIACYIRQKATQGGLFIPINKFLGYVKPIVFQDRDNGILRFPFAACSNSEEACNSSRNGNIGLIDENKDSGVLWIEANGASIEKRKGKEGKHCVHKQCMSLRLVWIIYHRRITQPDEHCICLQDYICNWIIEALSSATKDELQLCIANQCKVNISDIGINNCTIVNPLPMNIFGAYTESLYERYTRHPYEYGAIDFDVCYSSCSTPSYSFQIKDGKLCPISIKVP